jgi:hypothetical protein
MVTDGSQTAFPPKRSAAAPARTIALHRLPYPVAFETGVGMGWVIGRNAAMTDPEGARARVLGKLRTLAELDDPESLVVPIMIDAIMLVESYRGARHQPTFLPELEASVDALLRELTIVERSNEMAQ